MVAMVYYIVCLLKCDAQIYGFINETDFVLKTRDQFRWQRSRIKQHASVSLYQHIEDIRQFREITKIGKHFGA